MGPGTGRLEKRPIMREAHRKVACMGQEQIELGTASRQFDETLQAAGKRSLTRTWWLEIGRL